MTDCRVETKDRDTILRLSGELLIDYAAQLRSILIDSLREADRVEIDLSSVTAVDISCLQLFCAAHKTSVRMNRSLRFLGVRSVVLRQTARQAGWLRSSGCVPDKSTKCVWREEGYDE
jgi:anti-anti-sigma regulatory factor